MPASFAGELPLRGQVFAERLRRHVQRDAVLRALGTGDARANVGEIELERVGVLGGLRPFLAPQTLRLRVGLDPLDQRLLAAGQLQVGERLAVDREDAAGGAVLGGHVGDGRPVGEREAGEAVAVELDELADHALLAQHLDHDEHQIGRGRPGRELAVQAEADHLRQEHRDRLAEHGRLRLDAADAPAEHAETVDHGGVGVGADERVGVGGELAVDLAERDHVGQVLEVHLVDDAGAGRHDAEVVEGALAPAQEAVALGVPLELELPVQIERVGRGEAIDHDRVVDDQIDRDLRVDQRRIAAEIAHRVAHGGKIDDRGHAGEILQDHAGGREGDLIVLRRLRLPARQRLDVRPGDVPPVLVAEEVLEQDLQRERQAADAVGLFQGVEPPEREALATGVEGRAGGEAVHGAGSS